MACKIQHSFHGVLEPIQSAEMPTLPTLAIEGIELLVLVSALFIIFIAFKNRFIINSSRTFPMPGKEKLNASGLTSARPANE